MVGVEYAEYFRVLKFDEEREELVQEEMERRERESGAEVREPPQVKRISHSQR